MADKLVHYHMFDFKARAAVAVTTETVREAQRRHGLDPLTTIAFGRAIGCTALLASTLKQGKEYVHSSFTGTAMIKKVVAECNGDGDCRGYVTPPRILEDAPEGTEAPRSVGEAVGAGGLLTVTKGRPGDKSPYNAMIEIETGEIASDMARYLTYSEQVPSAVAAGVKLSSSGEVLSAGGVLVQRLGGAALEEPVLAALEAKMATHLNLTDRLAVNPDPDALIEFLADGDKAFGRLSTRELKFQCSCSRERMAGALMTLGEEQLRSIKEEIGGIDVRCPYCAAMHSFRLAELIMQ